jgi:outer membrane lipoprotein-sorting protein
MAIRSAFTMLLLCLTTGIAAAQSPDAFLGVLDKFAPTFQSAKATLRSIAHNQGVPDDDIQTGTFFVKRDGKKTQIRIDFTDPNVYAVFFNENSADIYHPKLNEMDEYDLRAYKDMATKLSSLGFGMKGSEIAANFDIRNLKHDTVDGQAAMHMELIPKSPDVLKQIKSIELWISDATMCPVRQIFHMSDGSMRTAEFSKMEVNPKLPGNTFELPHGAKRVKMN